jgi:hypothetical protein
VTPHRAPLRPWINGALTALGLGGLLAAPVSPLQSQGGIIALDSPVVHQLSPLRDRIDYAARLRFKTPWGTSVLADPRLLASGLGYDSLTSPGSHLRAPAFELQVRGRATGRGAVVGAGIAGLLGALLGTQLAGLCMCSRPPQIETALVVGVLGAAGGAVVGAIVGSQFTSWRTIYRYPDSAP